MVTIRGGERTPAEVVQFSHQSHGAPLRGGEPAKACHRRLKRRPGIWSVRRRKVGKRSSMTRGLTPEGEEKQLAGTCAHKWRSRKSPYFVAHICEICKLYRYKRSEEHTSELQSLAYLVCRLLLEKKKKIKRNIYTGYNQVKIK